MWLDCDIPVYPDISPLAVFGLLLPLLLLPSLPIIVPFLPFLSYAALELAGPLNGLAGLLDFVIPV